MKSFPQKQTNSKKKTAFAPLSRVSAENIMCVMFITWRLRITWQYVVLNFRRSRRDCGLPTSCHVIEGARYKRAPNIFISAVTGAKASGSLQFVSLCGNDLSGRLNMALMRMDFVAYTNANHHRLSSRNPRKWKALIYAPLKKENS